MAEIPVTENGAIVAAKVGDELVLRLPEPATAGYRWTVLSAGDIVDVVDDTYHAARESAAPGATGLRVIRMGVRKHGESDIVLVLRRSWEENVVVDRFTAHVAAQ